MAYKTNISTITQQRRNQIKALQDEFCTFSWGGEDAFEKFGAFIINEKKGSLKFYNGPDFSNEYTKPQFDNASGNLQGVTFNRQTITFTIGVYWFSIEEYRKLLHWLNPLKISYLTFGFNKNFRYNVKLSKRGDSTRWVIGKENGEPRYYTELPLTFELQGTPCAKGILPYSFKSSTNLNAVSKWNFVKDTSDSTVTGKSYLWRNDDFIASDLETPFQIRFRLNLQSDGVVANYFLEDNLEIKGSFNEEGSVIVNSEVLPTDSSSTWGYFDDSDGLKLTSEIDNDVSEYTISLFANYKKDKYEENILLCSFTLQHLALFIQQGYTLYFTYVSETGLVFITTNDTGIGSLLSQQTFTDSGEFLVSSLESYKFMLPGSLDHDGFYDGEISFQLKYKRSIQRNGEWLNGNIHQSCYDNQDISIECYPRTNII